jgi:hypothetical protein
MISICVYFHLQQAFSSTENVEFSTTSMFVYNIQQMCLTNLFILHQSMLVDIIVAHNSTAMAYHQEIYHQGMQRLVVYHKQGTFIM